MNIVLGEVEETRRVLKTSDQEGEEGRSDREIEGEPQWETTTRKRDMLFVRGDSIVLLSPLKQSI